MLSQIWHGYHWRNGPCWDIKCDLLNNQHIFLKMNASKIIRYRTFSFNFTDKPQDFTLSPQWDTSAYDQSFFSILYSCLPCIRVAGFEPISDSSGQSLGRSHFIASDKKHVTDPDKLHIIRKLLFLWKYLICVKKDRMRMQKWKHIHPQQQLVFVMNLDFNITFTAPQLTKGRYVVD